MPTRHNKTFRAPLLSPAEPGPGEPWLFLVLPQAVSANLSRRGRTAVAGSVNGTPFEAVLEPDGELSHWLKLPATLLRKAGIAAGDTVSVQLASPPSEPEPVVPDDLRAALEGDAAAMASWQATTTIARVDWIHWIETAKQQATRQRRVANACDMLAKGKKRVCCFDPSGHYSKAFGAPKAAE